MDWESSSTSKDDEENHFALISNELFNTNENSNTLFLNVVVNENLNLDSANNEHIHHNHDHNRQQDEHNFLHQHQMQQIVHNVHVEQDHHDQLNLNDLNHHVNGFNHQFEQHEQSISSSTNNNIQLADNNNNDLNLNTSIAEEKIANKELDGKGKMTKALNENIKRYNYRCKYCSFPTKFKVKIIEHMSKIHQINLMQCPICNKQVKDEWKLKRHLHSTREHAQMKTFTNLNDTMTAHVDVSEQKSGFPCPFCFTNQPQQQHQQQENIFDNTNSSINFVPKITENNLHFDSYEILIKHLSQVHPEFNSNQYNICKQCGQTFVNRYKLSSHRFNVHSGKRKLTKLMKSSTKSKSLFASANAFANGFSTTKLIRNPTKKQLKQLLPERKYLCTICERKFKRTRDLNIHVQIMHKNISETEKECIQKGVEKINSILKSKNLYLLSDFALNNQQSQQHNESELNRKATIHGNRSENSKTHSVDTKVCNVCNKVFNADLSKLATNDPNDENVQKELKLLHRTFTRHMQFQHGLSEQGERLVECPVCEKCFQNRPQMERHMHTHRTWIQDTSLLSQPPNMLNEDYRDKHSILYCHECVECKRFFKSIKMLAAHKKNVHNLKPIYTCVNENQCNLRFETVNEYLEHANLHSQKNICCTKCNLKFNKKNMLKNHMKHYHYNANGNANMSNQMLGDGMITMTNTSQGDSTSTSKTNKLNGKSVARKSNGPRKLNEFRNEEKNSFATNTAKHRGTHPCPTCGVEFNSSNSLHNHLATHNTSELKLFMCDICSHSFKTRKDLSKHAALHDFTKFKTCQECGMTFKTSFHLKRHTLTRHSNIRPFKCNHCEMTFARKDKLKQHEAKHVNHPLYECAQCNKGFYRKEHLKDHEISKHSKQFPFMCEHCGKGFVHAKDLHRHIRVRHLSANKSQVDTHIDDSIKETIKKVQSMGANKFSTNSNFSQQPQQPAEVKTLTNTAVSNDFKSKKISSLLKSAEYLNASSNNTNIGINNSFSNTYNSNFANYNLVPVNANNTNNGIAAQAIIPSNTNTTTNTTAATARPISAITINAAANIIQLNPNQIIQIPVNIPNDFANQFISIPIYHANILNDSKQNENLIIYNQTAINNINTNTNITNNNMNNNTNNMNHNGISFTKSLPMAETTNTIDSTIDSILYSTSSISANRSEKSFRCDVCDKQFFTEKNLHKHIQTKHSIKSQLSIQQHSQSQQQQQQLEEQQNMFSCSYCSQSFLTKSAARSHCANSHVDYTCPMCRKVYKSNQQARRHIKSQHSTNASSDVDILKPIRENKIESKVIERGQISNMNMSQMQNPFLPQNHHPQQQQQQQQQHQTHHQLQLQQTQMQQQYYLSSSRSAATNMAFSNANMSNPSREELLFNSNNLKLDLTVNQNVLQNFLEQ